MVEHIPPIETEEHQNITVNTGSYAKRAQVVHAKIQTTLKNPRHKTIQKLHVTIRY